MSKSHNYEYINTNKFEVNHRTVLDGTTEINGITGDCSPPAGLTVNTGATFTCHIETDDIEENTLDHGVTIDGALIKDGLLYVNGNPADPVEHLADKNQPNGYAGLDGSGKVPNSLLPATSSVPQNYFLLNVNLPNLSVDLRPLGTNLLSVTVENCTINSLLIPAVNDNFSGYTVINCQFPSDIPPFLLSGYPNLLIFYVSGSTINLSAWDFSNLPPICAELDLNNNSNVADTNYTIGNIAGHSLATVFIQGNKLTTIGTISSSMLSSLNISFNPILTSVGSITAGTSFALFQIAGNPSLTTIGSLAGIANQVSTGVDLSQNAFTATVVSQILIDFDNGGLLNGALDLSGGTNAGAGSLTPAGATARTNLLGKGWTIAMNP